MTRAEQYRLYAEEAERPAAQAPSHVERDAFLKVAQDWRELEKQATPQLAPRRRP